jgi:hypothetical protein
MGAGKTFGSSNACVDGRVAVSACETDRQKVRQELATTPATGDFRSSWGRPSTGDH